LPEQLRFGMYFETEVRGRSDTVEANTFNNVVSQIALGDALGYESAWLVEHHFSRGYSHSSAPDLTLAAVSSMTTRIRLGLGVMLLPFLHPVQVAERVATLDILSGGRVEFGTGRGASPLEYKTFGKPFEQSRELWDEKLEAVHALWRAGATEPVTLSGSDWEIPGVSAYPRPVQKPFPPTWVASTTLGGFIPAAQKGLNLLCMPLLVGLPALGKDLVKYFDQLEASGYGRDSRRVGMLVPWYVGNTVEEAREVAMDAMLWYCKRQINLLLPPDYLTARGEIQGVLAHVASGLPPEEALDMLIEHRMIVVSDVEGSVEKIREIQATGTTDLLAQFQVGGLDHEHVVESMTRFSREVIPAYQRAFAADSVAV